MFNVVFHNDKHFLMNAPKVENNSCMNLNKYNASISKVGNFDRNESICKY